jgi:hypothetical protein
LRARGRRSGVGFFRRWKRKNLDRPPPTKDFRLTKRRLGHSPRALKKQNDFSKKKKKTNENTYHTPTQEYVVPKSIPIAGPSDLDIFFFYVCV